MELTVNKAGKYALVWLTNAEKADPKVMDSLQPLIEQCKEKKYRLAIFESGEQDLLEKTTDLLIHNRGLCPLKKMERTFSLIRAIRWD